MILADLKHKNILIGVTGSIAIYKILEVIRLLIKSNANVKIIMTDSAKEFISPLTFETLSQNRVLDDTNQSWDKNSNFNHISLARWADIFIIAPATVNSINKIANGICDNILLQTIMAYNKKLLIAPSANTNMIINKVTQESLKKLKELNHKIISTQTKELACKEIGDGALASVEEIYFNISKELLKDNFWIDKNVVVTGGGTIEKIDDVRYISNFSSGKMSANLALALYLKGANVTLITTKPNFILPKDINLIKVQSTKEMFEAIKREKKEFLFQASAVSDFIPKYQKGKIKKENKEIFNLELTKNIDILKNIDKTNLITVGFKLESNEKDALNNAKKMLKEKGLDFVCLNMLKNNPFGNDENEIIFISKKEDIKLNRASKLQLSFEILELIKGNYIE